MLSSCLMTSSTLQSSNPPCNESRFRSRSLGMGPLLLSTPISWLIICDGVGVVLFSGLALPLLMATPWAKAARSRPEPPLLLQLLPLWLLLLVVVVVVLLPLLLLNRLMTELT